MNEPSVPLRDIGKGPARDDHPSEFAVRREAKDSGENQDPFEQDMHNPERYDLRRLRMTAAWAERLMRDMVSQALTELTDLYSVQHATLHRQQQYV